MRPFVPSLHVNPVTLMFSFPNFSPSHFICLSLTDLKLPHQRYRVLNAISTLYNVNKPFIITLFPPQRGKLVLILLDEGARYAVGRYALQWSMRYQHVE
mmetsp:Transcript_32024/g.44656  ORF Transcript_32024/g.44656 Transcript_32024/m.44656 type:complete len:99 (+) Transcript_32024:236-532(+)